MKTEIPKSPNGNKNSSNNIFSIDSFHSDYFDNINDIISKSPNKDENCKNQANSPLLLENIILILEKLTMTFKDEEKLLTTILKEIYIKINLIIKKYIFDLKKKSDLNNNDINKYKEKKTLMIISWIILMMKMIKIMILISIQKWHIYSKLNH